MEGLAGFSARFQLSVAHGPHKGGGTMIGFDLYILVLREPVSFTLAIGLIITAAAVATTLVLAWAAIRLSGDMRR
jgi:hypothetical protein